MNFGPCEIELEKKEQGWRVSAKGWPAIVLVTAIAVGALLYFVPTLLPKNGDFPTVIQSPAAN